MVEEPKKPRNRYDVSGNIEVQYIDAAETVLRKPGALFCSTTKARKGSANTLRPRRLHSSETMHR